MSLPTKTVQSTARFLFVLVMLAPLCVAQPAHTGTATISERVTLSEEPAAGVTVIAAYRSEVQAAQAYGSLLAHQRE